MRDWLETTVYLPGPPRAITGPGVDDLSIRAPCNCIFFPQVYNNMLTISLSMSTFHSIT